MTKSKITFGALALSLLFASVAIASPENKGLLKLFDSVTVGGKQLAPGKYQLEWTGSGSNVELTITSGKETVAKVPAHLVILQKTGAGSGYTTNANPGGSLTLTEIYFGGKKYELSLGESSAATATSGKAQASN